MALEVLFGSKSVKRVLTFLLVNEKCYGSEVARLLEIPLTPIQKALFKLEEGGILESQPVGKTTLYRFNPNYPLLEELEALIKRAYANLPASEKKGYIYIAPSRASVSREKRKLLLTVWEQLQTVCTVRFTAKSNGNSPTGWNGFAEGEVVVEPSQKSLLFHEKGSFSNPDGNTFTFRNVFRFTLDRLKGMISLEHLRLGPNRPVLLFHLVPSGKNTLESFRSHLCGEDAYFGKISLDERSIHLHWRILGPQKNAELDYIYESAGCKKYG